MRLYFIRKQISLSPEVGRPKTGDRRIQFQRSFGFPSNTFVKEENHKVIEGLKA